MTSVTINKDNIKIKKNDGMRAKITPTTKTGRLLTHTIMDMQDGGLPSNEKMNEMSEILIKVLEAERKNTGDMKTQKMLHQLQIVIDDWQQTMNTKNHDETIQRLIQIVGKQGSDLSRMRMDNVNFDQETLNIGENFRKLVPKLVGLSKAVIKDSAFRELLLSLLDVGKRNFKDNKDVLNVDRGHSGPHVAKNIPPPPPLPRDDYDYDYDNVDRGRRGGKLDKGLHKGTSTKSYTNQRSTPPYLRKTDHTLTVENRDNLGYNDYDNRTTTKVETTGLGQQPGFQSDFDKEFQHFEKKEHNQIGQQTGSLAPPYIGEMERGTYAPPPPAPPLPQSLRVNRNVNQPLGGNREHPEFINIEPEKHTTVIEREREYHTTKKGQSIPVPPPPPSPNDLYSVNRNRNQKLVRDDDYIENNRKPKSSLIDLLREDIQDTDTVKMDRTAQVLKSKVKQLDVKITDSEREQLIDKAIYALISIRSKPQYRSLFKNIFEIYTELSKMWRKVSTRPELKQEYTKSAVILNEIRILLERASGRSIETWLGHFRDFQYIMKDKTYLKIVSGIEDLVLDKNEKYTTPEAMKAKMNDIQRNVEKLNNQYGQVLGNLLDESAEIIRGIANDPQIAKLTQDTNLLFMQMFTDEAGRPSPAVAFDSLMRIKSVFLPVLIRNLQVFNLPTIFLENEQIEFTLSDVALQTKHILPDMFHFDFEANMDLNVRRNTREGRFALRINVRPISIDLDNVSYNFKKKSGFRFRDYGVLDISIRNASFFIDVACYLDKDEIAEFEVRRVRTDLGKIKIDIINAKHEAMDKMATSLFLGGITKRLNKMISEKIHDALQNGLFTRINDGLVRAEQRRKEQRIKQRKLKKERAINRKRMTIRKRGVGTTKVKKNKKHGRVRGKVAKGKTTKGKVVKGKVAKGRVVSQSEESSYVVEEKYEEKPTLGGKKVEEKREVKRPHGTKVETKTEKKGKKISQKREVEHPTGKKVVVDKKKDVKHHDSDTHELRHHGDKKRDLKHPPHDLTRTEEVELGKIHKKRDMEDIREVSSSISDEERPRDRVRDKGRMSKV